MLRSEATSMVPPETSMVPPCQFKFPPTFTMIFKDVRELEVVDMVSTPPFCMVTEFATAPD